MAVSDHGRVTELAREKAPPKPIQPEVALTSTAARTFPIPSSPTLVQTATAADVHGASLTPERKAARLAAIESEIRSLGEASLSWPVRAVAAWQKLTIGSQAPFAMIKRKAGRYRLPRRLKAELIECFVSGEHSAFSSFTTLIVVAHPDDESIGAGARLRHLGNAYVVDVTDGAPRDVTCAQRHGFDTREAYAEARRRELHDALTIAGLPLDRLIMLGFVDGEVSLRLPELCLKVSDLMDSLRPQVVLTHPYEGGHTDHDATAFAVHLACGVLQREGIRPPAVLELTSYHARNGKKVVQQFLPYRRADRGQRTVQLTTQDREVKQRMFESFESQRPLLEQFSMEFERFRPAPRYVFTEPPHEGQLNYERYGNPQRGRVWREHAQRALRVLHMRRD
jgi:LmbE family N-acetylglucosaminyl deacetylase